jgi:hypothetical protein
MVIAVATAVEIGLQTDTMLELEKQNSSLLELFPFITNYNKAQGNFLVTVPPAHGIWGGGEIKG